MKCWPVRELCKPFPGSAAARLPVQRTVVAEVCQECPSWPSCRTPLSTSPFSGGQGGVGKMQEKSHPLRGGKDDVALRRVQRGCPRARPYGPAVAISSKDGRWEMESGRWEVSADCHQSAWAQQLWQHLQVQQQLSNWTVTTLPF